MAKGTEGLLPGKARPPGTPRTPDEKVAEVIRLTQDAPPHEATHWTIRAMGKAVGLAASTVQDIWKAHGPSPHRWRQFKPSNDRAFAIKCGPQALQPPRSRVLPAMVIRSNGGFAPPNPPTRAARGGLPAAWGGGGRVEGQGTIGQVHNTSKGAKGV